jgi:hypothetical protein
MMLNEKFKKLLSEQSKSKQKFEGAAKSIPLFNMINF